MTHISVTIFHRKDDKKFPWWVNWTLPSGRRVRKPAARRKDLARRIAREYELQLNRGTRDPQLLTVQAFFDEFLASVSSRAPKTLRGYHLTATRFCNLFGTTRLLSITATHIDEFKNTLQHLAPATQARTLRELSVALNRAVKRDYIPRNPCSGVTIPRIPKNPPKPLDKPTVRRLLHLVNHTPYHGIIAIALYAGLRREEIVWLDWDDVDLQHRQLYLRNKPEHPLKDYEARTVPIPKPLVQILKTLPHNTQPVFTSPEGKRWNTRNLSHRLTPHFRALHIPGALHLLRHTYASHLVMAGVDIVSVQKLLGHASITTTMIYAHIAQDHLKKQIDKLTYE